MERLSFGLTRRLDGVRTCHFGVSAQDIENLKVETGLVREIIECLKSDEFVDLQMALLFAETLLTRETLDTDHAKAVVLEVKQLCVSKHGQVHGPAIKMLERFHKHVPEYRTIMLRALHYEDPMARRQALVFYSTYCRAQETEPLEPFERDNYMAETSMGGPLVYELRNLALETIEKVLDTRFKTAEETEALSSGEVVYWWS